MSNIWSRLINLGGNITGILLPGNGGTGIANNASSTLTISGAFPTTLTVSNTTGVTLPTTGTLLANSRNINTTAPITGGGDLSADRTIAISAIAQSTSGVDASAAQRLGTNTNDAASAGNIGEYKESKLTSLTNVPASAQFFDARSLTLTAGDWDVVGGMTYARSGATVATPDYLCGISTTTGNSGTNLVKPTTAYEMNTTDATSAEFWITSPLVRVQSDGTNLYFDGNTATSTQVIFLKGYYGTFSVGNVQYRAFIRARRVR